MHLVDELGDVERVVPTYTGVRIQDQDDAQALILAFLKGRIRGFTRKALSLQQRASLVASGNVVIYIGDNYRDGHTWANPQSICNQSMDVFAREGYPSFLKFCPRSFQTTKGTAHLVSYWDKTDTIYPRASESRELRQLCLSIPNSAAVDDSSSEIDDTGLEDESCAETTVGTPAPRLFDEDGNCIGPTYTGVHIEDAHDIQTIIEAYLNGFIQAVSLQRIPREQLPMLVASGNVVIHRGPKYQDGHSWGKRKQKKRDDFNLQTYSSKTVKGLQKFFRTFHPTPETTYRIVSYQKVNEKFPRASSVPELRQFANYLGRNGDTPPTEGVPRFENHDRNHNIGTTSDGHETVMRRDENERDSRIPGPVKHCAPVKTQGIRTTVSTEKDDCQGSWVYLGYPGASPPDSERVQVTSEPVLATCHDPQATIISNASEWMMINRESNYISTIPCPSSPCLGAVKSQSSQYSPEYFQAFVQSCPHLWDIPGQLTEDRQHYIHLFFSRLVTLHASPGSSCFAATEAFALEYQGTPCVLAVLAVLREQFDICLPQYVDGTTKCQNELLVDFVFLPVPDQAVSAPLTWLEIQTLGSHFQSERIKRAAWALGQLRPGSHAPGSASFKWIRQILSREPLRSGMRQVVDLLPGDSTQEWPLLRRLKTRLYHPANLSLNSELMTLLDEDLRLACKHSLQEWCIALVYEMAKRPNDAASMCRLYRDYMMEVTELQIKSFAQTGYENALHTCSHNPCQHTKPHLNSIKAELCQTLECFIESLLQRSFQGSLHLYGHPNSVQLQYASALGLQCYWLQTSYILLSPAERLHYDCLCRTRLNDLRAELTAKVGAPVLIWNYLPDDIQAWAARQRQTWETGLI